MSPETRRRRVLISAYACGPGDEPEAGAGWGFAVAAARTSDVWVITRQRFSGAIHDALAADPELRAHLHPVHVEVTGPARRLYRNPSQVYWYYSLWQREFVRVARRLDAEVHFDVVHHMTFANDWLPCGAASLRSIPAMVWGPVGGSSRVPLWRLREWLGPRALAVELVRLGITSAARAMWGASAARHASLIVAQNPDVADHFAGLAPTIVEPNAIVDVAAHAPRPTPHNRPRVALHVARLIPWKGGRLCLDTIARTAADEWRLEIIGVGPERARLERHAERLGIADRVSFRGQLPREEVLRAFETADALLFPSMHDQAGWVAAEASTLGCPVVCLPLGGPPLLAAPNAFVADLDGDLVANLAAQLRRAGASRGIRHHRWSRDRLPGLVDRWYRTAAGEEPDGLVTTEDVARV